MNRTLIVIIAILVIVLGVLVFRMGEPTGDLQRDERGQLSQAADKKIIDLAQIIEVTAPLNNAQISSPTIITGRARGSWYFEASFPVILIDDATSSTLATGIAQAQGDWMTEDWVPFSTSLTFAAQPSGSTGKLILRNDNPSGEPANDMSVIIPVTF